MASKAPAELNPLRLSYTMFADSNPMMQRVAALAEQVTANRKPASPDNPFLALQKQLSDQIIAVLNTYRDSCDATAERMFFGIYGSPVVQGLLGMNTGDKVRELPGTTPEKLAAQKAQQEAYAAKLSTGGFDEALARAVLYVVSADRALDERCASALGATCREVDHLSVEQFKALVRDEFFVLLLERERAVEALPALVPDPDQRKALLQRVGTIVGAGGQPSSGERERMARLQKLLGPGKAAASRPPREVAAASD